jgi:hypothetical protein
MSHLCAHAPGTSLRGCPRRSSSVATAPRLSDDRSLRGRIHRRVVHQENVPLSRLLNQIRLARSVSRIEREAS